MRDDASPSPPEGQRSVETQKASKDACQTVLRVLATTDIHMQFLGHDYVSDTAGSHNGLAGLATLIKFARSEGVPSVLVDNGDMLQGNAFGDALANMPVTPQHPVITSLNMMGYDVIGVGNHDFDHGLTYLQRVAGMSRAQFISTNLEFNADTVIARSAIVPKTLTDRNGVRKHKINVGFLSVLPILTNIWNKPMLKGHGRITPARDALMEAIPAIRQAGADIVILLAHMGIEEDFKQDDVRTLSAIPGLDAMIAGHTHRRLPGRDHEGLSDVDINKGALGPRPAAMPGFGASDLAVLDLNLTSVEPGAWYVSDHQVHLRQNTKATPADSKISSLCAPSHTRTRLTLAEPLAESSVPLHNYFALAMPTPTCALQAAATLKIVAEGLQGSANAKLPLLSVVSAHTAGGRGGPGHYINIPAGKVYRRSVAGLNPYGNMICALRITGAELRAWLEHSAAIYTHLQADVVDQPLLRRDRPKFHFDTIYGVRYDIDPTQPEGQRIRALTLSGVDVEDDQMFAVATNEFRAAGGGGGLQFDPDRVIFESEVSVNDAFLVGLKSGLLDEPAFPAPWYFNCPDLKATLWTSPQAQNHLPEVSHLQPQVLPLEDSGFLPLRLRLPGLHSPGPRRI